MNAPFKPNRIKLNGVFGKAQLVLVFSMVFMACNKSAKSGNYDITLVCFGDSLTAGHGAVTPGVDDESKSYPAYLQDKINITVINAGVSGDTTADGLLRVDADVLSKDPHIVIIELGANDLFQEIPPETTQANLQSIINKVNTGNRKIYMAKFYTDTVARAMAGAVGITDDSTQTALIDQYNNMFSTLASLNGIILIEDIWSGVWGIHMSDDIHPDAAGYALMADNYFDVLLPYLQANNLLK